MSFVYHSTVHKQLLSFQPVSATINSSASRYTKLSTWSSVDERHSPQTLAISVLCASAAHPQIIIPHPQKEAALLIGPP